MHVRKEDVDNSTTISFHQCELSFDCDVSIHRSASFAQTQVTACFVTLAARPTAIVVSRWGNGFFPAPFEYVYVQID